MNILLKINNSTKTIAIHTIEKGQGLNGKVVHIQGQDYVKYDLVDGNGFAPKKIITKRVGKNLHIVVNDTGDINTPDIIIDNYYEHSSSLVGQTENGLYHNYIPESGYAGASNVLALDINTAVTPFFTDATLLGSLDLSDGLLVGLGVLGLGAVAGGIALATGGGSSSTAEHSKPPSSESNETSKITAYLPNINASNVNAVPISGTSSGVSANSIVTITIKDGSGHTVTVTANIEADGSYSTTADLSALTDGTITVTVAGVDNNKLLIATTDNVIQDAVKGELITIVPNINATNADTVVFSGHTTDVAKGTPVFIRIEDGTGKVVTTTATVNPDGTYSTDFADLNTLTDGVITITGTTTDHNGKALTTTHTDSLDLLSGMITAAIPDVNTANVSAVSISGRTTDIAAGAPILLTIHDKQGNSIVVTTTVTASGTYSVTTNFSGLDDGAITITAVATDNNGNQVVINTHSQLDVTVPTIPLITDNNALGLSGTAEPNRATAYKLALKQSS